jgi:hypothetical protein
LFLHDSMNITKLPNRLKITASLNLCRCDIEFLPEDLEVGYWIRVEQEKVERFRKNNFKFKKKIIGEHENEYEC